MPLIHRCDKCSKEVIPPIEGGFAPGWLVVFCYPEEPNLVFCSQSCITEHYASKRKAHYPMEKP